MIDGVDAFARIGEHFDVMLADLSPAKRKFVARKIGYRLRRIQSERIAANIEPSGDAMAPRKLRLDRRGKRVRRGRMFRRLRLARSFDVTPSAEGVELGVKSRLAAVASVHHFGLEGFVGKTADGRTIRARYEARQLLGFGAEDLEALTDELFAWLEGE